MGRMGGIRWNSFIQLVLTIPMNPWTGLLFLLPLPLLAQSEVPAFPGIEGDGRYATGGRGGTVVKVTNLNASGPGSLADAVKEGNRIVIFEVSGIIDLTRRTKNGELEGGRIDIEHPNVTIAGQTAPGEGICLKGGTLTISADNVIIRHLRSRRGFIVEGDSGDGITVKPPAIGSASTAAEAPGRNPAKFEKALKKKQERGKEIGIFKDLNHIVIDHCSTSWATDENLSMTHAGNATMSWCIAAEGCDYPNPKQTPPNHSEGSLWGSSAPGGRSTLHHTLYAHNRLRNPRTVGGADEPPILTFYNNVVYNWSEFPTHTGSEKVNLLWLNSFYKPGPSTPEAVRGVAFEFHGSPEARVFPSGIVVEGRPEETRDNRLAVSWQEGKMRKMDDAVKQAMIASSPWGELPEGMQSAAEAFESVLDQAGATLPSRDAVDLRITRAVRAGTGKVIGKETDLAEDQRWPDYRSLPPLPDADGDGLPDYWEAQFGEREAAEISNGYANIEHYFNNTDPAGGEGNIVYVGASISRAYSGQAGEWRIYRTGSVEKDLEVAFELGGDVPGKAVIPAGKGFAAVPLDPKNGSEKAVVLTLKGDRVGCPSRALIIIR